MKKAYLALSMFTFVFVTTSKLQAAMSTPEQNACVAICTADYDKCITSAHSAQDFAVCDYEDKDCYYKCFGRDQ